MNEPLEKVIANHLIANGWTLDGIWWRHLLIGEHNGFELTDAALRQIECERAGLAWHVDAEGTR